MWYFHSTQVFLFYFMYVLFTMFHYLCNIRKTFETIIYFSFCALQGHLLRCIAFRMCYIIYEHKKEMFPDVFQNIPNRYGCNRIWLFLFAKVIPVINMHFFCILREYPVSLKWFRRSFFFLVNNFVKIEYRQLLLWLHKLEATWWRNGICSILLDLKWNVWVDIRARFCCFGTLEFFLLIFPLGSI